MCRGAVKYSIQVLQKTLPSLQQLHNCRQMQGICLTAGNLLPLDLWPSCLPLFLLGGQSHNGGGGRRLEGLGGLGAICCAASRALVVVLQVQPLVAEGAHLVPVHEGVKR